MFTRLLAYFGRHHVALLALFFALAGTSYAAWKLPAGSVTSREVKDHSLLARDFKAGQLPRGATGPEGAQGPQGPAGAQGPPGAPLGYAHVRFDGPVDKNAGPLPRLDANRSSGVNGVSTGYANGFAMHGTACFDLAFVPHNAVVTSENAFETYGVRDLAPDVPTTAVDVYCPPGYTSVLIAGQTSLLSGQLSGFYVLFN